MYSDLFIIFMHILQLFSVDSVTFTKLLIKIPRADITGALTLKTHAIQTGLSKYRPKFLLKELFQICMIVTEYLEKSTSSYYGCLANPSGHSVRNLSECMLTDAP